MTGFVSTADGQHIRGDLVISIYAEDDVVVIVYLHGAIPMNAEVDTPDDGDPEGYALALAERLWAPQALTLGSWAN
jgi:hypothetical protein